MVLTGADIQDFIEIYKQEVKEDITFTVIPIRP